MTEQLPELSVVIGTLNEAGNIAPMVSRLNAALAGLSWEVVFVDDDSPDGTADVVRAVAKADSRVRLVHRVGRRGLASACIEGIQAARAPAVAVIDADLQHDETLLPRMLATLKADDLDLVVGSRHVAGGGVGDFSYPRRAISRLGHFVSRLAIEAPVRDLMSGFFMLKREFFEEVAPRLSGIGYKILFDILSSARRPVRFVELPFRFGSRLHGQSKMDAAVTLDHFRLIAAKAWQRFRRSG